MGTIPLTDIEGIIDKFGISLSISIKFRLIQNFVSINNPDILVPHNNKSASGVLTKEYLYQTYLSAQMSHFNRYKASIVIPVIQSKYLKGSNVSLYLRTFENTFIPRIYLT